MLGELRSRLTYANVMVTIALFVALGGGAYAAFNPIGQDGDVDACYTRQSGDLFVQKRGTCGKGTKPIAWSQEGPQGPQGPLGPTGDTGPQGPAGDTSAAPQPEAPTAVANNPLSTSVDPCGTGQSGIFCGTVFTGSGTYGHWSNVGGAFAPVTFYKDREAVHLSGIAELFPNSTQARVFILPQGYRPAATLEFTTSCWQSTMNNYDNCLVSVNAAGEVSFAGGYFPAASDGGMSFDGISFRVP